MRRFTVDSIEMELVVVVEECKSAVITYTPYIAIIHSVVFCSYCTVQPCVRCRLCDVTVLTHKASTGPNLCCELLLALNLQCTMILYRLIATV